MELPISSQENVNRKRRRNDSTSSNSTNHKKSPVTAISTVRTEDDSDNSAQSNSSSLVVLQGVPFQVEITHSPVGNTAKTNYNIFLRKARALLRATRDKHRKKKLPRKSGSLLEAIDKVLSPRDDYRKMFSTAVRSIKWLQSLPGYQELYLQVTQAESSTDEEPDDNVPSTSQGIQKQKAKLNTQKSTSQSPSSRRKRRASNSSLSNNLSKDPDISYEPPLAKRQQRVPSIYQSQPNSVASSVYPSPLNELLAQDIETESTTSAGNSTDGEHDIAGNAGLAAASDSPNSDDDSTTESDSSDIGSDHVCPYHNCPEGCANESLEDEIISHITSPYPAPFRRTAQVPGERTPAPCVLEQEDDKSNLITASQEKIQQFEDYSNAIYDCMTPAAESDLPRQCPLPALSWANAHDVWQTMCKKDEEATCLRDAGMLERHPGLQPRMRAILLDWLIEVCEVYKLHRETYYLAVDYLDRYLTSKFKVQKTHLQLIGITCLFVAAKVEEIYPPKIGEFAYVTDGACQEADILHNEIMLLQVLDWDINPVTPIGWLGVYMQLNVNNRTPKTLPPKSSTHLKENRIKGDNIDEGFIYPQFSGFEFVQTAQLLDLCSLDVGVAHFSYSVLAAAAMSHTFNKETALRCSGLDWQTIQPCARWMEPFFVIVSAESDNFYMMEQNEQVPSKFGLGHICTNITTDDSHIIQTHTITMQMFDRVTQMQLQLLSPANGHSCPTGLLTPPASSRKPLDVLTEDHSKTTVKSTIPTKTASNVTTNVNANKSHKLGLEKSVQDTNQKTT